MERIYLDYQATTPVDPVVFEKMKPYFEKNFGNPSSIHFYGHTAAASVELAVENILHYFNVPNGKIIFTSGATESINLVLKGLYFKNNKLNFITQKTEHPAVLNTLEFLSSIGAEIKLLNVDSEGIINLNELENSISHNSVVSMMGANNEIGTIQDLNSISKICKNKGAVFHCDATQLIPYEKIDLNELEIDFISFSGHKFYGPKGIGGLLVREKSLLNKITPLIHGGKQQNGIRGGTLNVPAIVGLSESFSILKHQIESESKKILNLRNNFLNKLTKEANDIKVNGSLKYRIPGNLNILIPGIRTDILINQLQNISFSAGSACSSGEEKLSHVLSAIGLNSNEILSSFRIGIGRFTTENEINRAAEHFINAIKRIRETRDE